MPPLPAGFYPFWFWNDTLTDDEIRWQVAQMAAQGVRGFFIHSRQGLKDPPYLSEAFFDRVETAVLAAQEHGLVVHLYDEYPYPSGAGGGLVTLGEPRFHATALVQRVYDVPGGPLRLELPPGRVLALVGCPLRAGAPDWSAAQDLLPAVGAVLAEDSYQLTGLTAYNQKRYFSGRPRPVLQTALPPGEWRVFASIQALVEDHKYWRNFTDVLNPAAVARFIEITHQRYRARLGPHFGKTVRWIFTDETLPGWSAGLPALFREAYDYDLLPLLPALQDPAHPNHERVSRDLYALRYAQFCRAFEEPISGWCRQAGLSYAAEKPSMRFSQLRYQDIPGCEPGHVKVGAPLDLLQPRPRGNARAAASAAYFYGKDGALDECYHSLGWSATLEDARWMADAQLLLGIRYLVPHGFFYSTHNLRKHDAPATFFFQAPYWPFFGQLARRVERISSVLKDAWIDARLVVVDPSWGQPLHPELSAYHRLLRLLVENHLDFHIADTDVLEAGEIGAGSVRLRDLQVRAVLAAPTRFPDPALETWLARFEAAGGRVLRPGVDFDDAELLAALGALVRPALSLRSAGRENPAVWCASFRRPGWQGWLALNVSGEPQDLALEAACPLAELPLDPLRAPRLRQENGACFRRLEPFEALLLEAAPAAPAPAQLALPAVTFRLDGEMDVRPLNANLVRLGRWELALLDEAGGVLQSAPVDAAPLANQLEQGGLRFAPRVERTFGCPPELRWPALRLRYTAAFENEYGGPVALLMEPGSIGGAWRARLNGGPALGPAAFAPSAQHVRGSLSADLTPWLRPGINTLELEVESGEPDGGLLNPLYLCGDFGARAHPLALTPPVSRGRFEEYAANRLPFYAGALEYTCALPLDELPSAPRLTARLAFPAPFHEALEVSINGGPARALPWGPYELDLDASELRPGQNTLCLRVHTTLVRSFEGQSFDYAHHAYQEV